MNKFLRTFPSLLISCLLFISYALNAQQKKPLTFEDIMKFKQIKNPAISAYGNWVSYNANPDRGNGEVFIRSTNDERFYEIERGSKPLISEDENWTAVTILPEFTELEKEKKDKPKNDLVLLNNTRGDTAYFRGVKNFQFSPNSLWLAFHFHEAEAKDSIKEGNKRKKTEIKPGTRLIIKKLDSGNEIPVEFVDLFTFDSSSHYLAYTIKDTSKKNNGLFLIDLEDKSFPALRIDTAYNGYYSNLTWHKSGSLAFLKSTLNEKDEPDTADLYVWDGELKLLMPSEKSPAGWIIPAKNKLQWTKEGERLFFGFRSPREDKDEIEEDTVDINIYDIEKILEKKESDVWHWNDPVIKTHEKKRWEEIKDRTYPAVYHIETGITIPLTDDEMPFIAVSDNPNYVLGYSDIPYLKEITWDGWYYDYYIVDLERGKRKKIASHIERNAQLSPNGNYAAYYDDKNWHLYDAETGSIRNLTERVPVPFFNEDHDYPSAPPAYGIAGWLEDDEAVLIYDKYDIWKFPAKSHDIKNLTNGYGRKNEIIFRIQKLDPEMQFFKRNEKLLLTGYNDKKKHTGFYGIQIDRDTIKKLLEKEKRFTFLAKAKLENKYLYTRESYTEFPDLWISNDEFNKVKRITNLSSQTDRYVWGTAELVNWESMDGIPLQGVLIKPADYKKGKKYPVIVYFYRFFSQRLYEFSDMVINHRPNFPFYTGEGYAVFLPDIKFEVGRPGLSAVKCLVPGVQKLIAMGIADPNAVGLHGHSWSGYQTAFVITQTNIFACAIAGAPVSNMTSAYSGIRWGSGLARQFQYEKAQSRLGASLWENRERYIENSPVFYADKINTPLLIMHGDEDEAVPWYQSIELYLAMRRLGKDCVFLQYRGEPHHPHKYPNKLDYTIKMKEYFDYHLKGELPPEWIINGVPYSE